MCRFINNVTLFDLFVARKVREMMNCMDKGGFTNTTIPAHNLSVTGRYKIPKQ